MAYVTVPGIGGSDDGHWQSLWENEFGTSAIRIQPASWDEPDLDNWTEAITTAVTQAGPGAVLIAHSLGCLAATHWLAANPDAVRAVFLVAAPNRHGPAFPAGPAASFVSVEPRALPVPGLLVSSDDDPYCSPEVAQELADAWRTPRVSVGAHRHLNTESGHGEWPVGRELLAEFTSTLT